MGNKQTKIHLENASKTGVCTLANAKLKELPPELFKLTKLRSLDISSNCLSRYPRQIELLTTLKVLNLAQNRLTELTVLKLSKLESLNGRDNLLQKCPDFSACTNLKTIDLSNNHLTDFPAKLGPLQNLTAIDLRANRIERIADCANLKCVEINLNQNRLCHLPDELSTCRRLKVLRIEENCLSNVSSVILKESTISTLYFDGNLFDKKQLENTDGWEDYSLRYTQSKQKAD